MPSSPRPHATRLRRAPQDDVREVVGVLEDRPAVPAQHAAEVDADRREQGDDLHGTPAGRHAPESLDRALDELHGLDADQKPRDRQQRQLDRIREAHALVEVHEIGHEIRRVWEEHDPAACEQRQRGPGDFASSRQRDPVGERERNPGQEEVRDEKVVLGLEAGERAQRVPDQAERRDEADRDGREQGDPHRLEPAGRPPGPGSRGLRHRTIVILPAREIAFRNGAFIRTRAVPRPQSIATARPPSREPLRSQAPAPRGTGERWRRSSPAAPAARRRPSSAPGCRDRAGSR